MACPWVKPVELAGRRGAASWMMVCPWVKPLELVGRRGAARDAARARLKKAARFLHALICGPTHLSRRAKATMYGKSLGGVAITLTFASSALHHARPCLK